MSRIDLPLEVSEAMKDASRVFGRYILIHQLGRGGMGTVYKAWQVPLKRYVALKILHEGESEDNLARFMREAQTASQLHHPNIAAIYEVGNHAGRFFIAMQFIDGVTLDALFERKLEREKLLKILRAASLAVHAAHEKGVVHRDLKPSNIMLSKEGRPFVLDFGIARQLRGGDTLTEAGMVVGTPTYMAPEQASGNPQMVDRRSDIWSLGVILYEVLTGTVPHRGRSPAETLMFLVNQDPPAPSTRSKDVPREIEAVCMKALERERRRRYPTAEEFAQDIQRWLDGTAVSAKPLTVMEKLQRKMVRLRRQIAVALALAVLVAAGLVGTSVVRRTKRERTRIDAREAMGRSQWARAIQLWSLLGDDPEAIEKRRECEVRVDEMQRTSALRAGQEEMEKASAAFEQALDLRRRPGSRARFAELLRSAESHARKALSSHGKEVKWWRRLGEILYELRDPGAADAYSQVIALDGADAAAHYLRARITTRRCMEAILLEAMPTPALQTLVNDIYSDIRRAAERGLEPGKQRLADAIICLQENRLRDLEKLAPELARSAGEDPEALEILARVHLDLKQTPASEAVTSELRRLRPNEPFYVVLHAEAALDRDDLAAADARFREAVAMDPANLNLRHVIGVMYLQAGMLQGAQRELEPVVSGDARNLPAAWAYAESIFHLDRQAQARELFRRVVTEGRDHVTESGYFQSLLRLKEQIQLIDESEPVIRRLEALGTPAARRQLRRVRLFRGASYLTLQQWEPCLKEFETALALGEKDWGAYSGVATALSELKRDLPRALEHARMAVTRAKIPAARKYCEEELRRLEALVKTSEK